MMTARADCHELRCINKTATRSQGHDVVPSAAGLFEECERNGAKLSESCHICYITIGCRRGSRCCLYADRHDSIRGNNHGVTSVTKTTLEVTKVPMLPGSSSPTQGTLLGIEAQTFGKDGAQLIFRA